MAISTGWRKFAFRQAYVADGGSPNAANSYVTYINRVDRLANGLDQKLEGFGAERTVEWAENLPATAYGSVRNRRDSLAALRAYVRLMPWRLGVPSGGQLPPAAEFHRSDEQVSLTKSSTDRPDADLAAEIRDILVETKVLATRYRALTGKPLGVTGEIAELVAAELLGITLHPARTPGYDGSVVRDGVRWRIQIKGRAVDPSNKYRGTCPSIKCGDRFDSVLLVLLDRETFEALEIWEATEAAVVARIAGVSKAKQARNALAITQFRSIADRVWPSA